MCLEVTCFFEEKKWGKLLKLRHFHLFLVTKSCSTLCDPVDCSPPGSSVHGISQDTEVSCQFLLQGTSQPGDWTHISCITGRIFTTELPMHWCTLRSICLLKSKFWTRAVYCFYCKKYLGEGFFMWSNNIMPSCLSCFQILK